LSELLVLVVYQLSARQSFQMFLTQHHWVEDL